MKKSCLRSGGFAAVLLGLLTFSPFPLVHRAAAQVAPTHRKEIPNFDKRTAVGLKAEAAAQREQGEAQLKTVLPQALVSVDPLLHTAKFIRSQDGFLTGPNGEGVAVSASAAQAIPASDP